MQAKQPYQALKHTTMPLYLKNEEEDQWNRIKSPEIDPGISKTIYYKDVMSNYIAKMDF